MPQAGVRATLAFAAVRLAAVAEALDRGAAAAEAQPKPRAASAPVLQEPEPRDFYGFLREYEEVPLRDFDPSAAPTVPRVRDLDDETFQRLVRDGSPFVVEDCVKGFGEGSLSELTCKDFADRWPSGNMRAEYTEGQYHIYLRDPTWYTKIEPRKSNKEHMAGGKPIAGPYVWHVKDEEPLKTKREIQQHWRTPYFLQKSLANRIEANESFEFWFSMAGGGTFAHADAYCESTVSLQLRGTKRWRIQAFPRGRHFLNATAFHDGQIYGQKQHTAWAPETEFKVGPGECVVFPTGYLHETYVDPEDNPDGECYTATTFQFNHPRQVNLYRAYLSSFSMSHYGMGEPCLQGMASYATLFSDSPSVRGDGREPDPQAIRAEAERLLRRIDSSGDGTISRDELYSAFGKEKSSRAKLMSAAGFNYGWSRMLTKSQRAELEEEAMGVWSEDALQYHDINRDKVVTLDELTHGLLHWAVVQSRLRATRALSKRTARSPKKWLGELLRGEEGALRKHFCGDEDPGCAPASELEAFGRQLATEDAALKRKARQVSRMFEEGDGGDGEELLLVDRETGAASQKSVGSIRAGEL